MLDPVFLAASLALLLIPGPAVLYIVSRSVAHGRLAGLATVAGVAAGSLVHVAAAALGLSAVLVSSAGLFRVVKLVGAAYLVYLGVRTFRSGRATEYARPVPAGPWGLFRQGVVVNLLNPKTAVFFLAFLPQFADPARGSLGWQVARLGTVFVTIGLVTDSGYALAAGTFGAWLRSREGQRLQRRLSGAILVTLGVGAALAGD